MEALSSPATRKFFVVRPYPAKIRERVFEFLGKLGYVEGGQIDVGTPDEEAARQVLACRDIDLLLLPYHKHRDSNDTWVNGFGVALRLNRSFRADIPIVMPVDEFTFAGSFQRELDELEAGNPDLISQLVVMRQRDIGSDEIAQRIQRAA